MSKLVFLLTSFILFFQPLVAFEISSDVKIFKVDKSHIVDVGASDLSYYLENILGKKIPFTDKISTKYSTIILKKSHTHNLKEDGFIIDITKNNINISAENDRGVLYGVYYFLDHYLGCKFLAEDYTYVPHYTQKKLDNIHDIQEPAFRYRELFYKESDDPVFAFKLLLNGRLGHRTLYDEAQDTYTSGIKSYSFTSAELLGDKYTCSGQYLYASKKAQKEAYKALQKELRSLPHNEEKYLTLEHEDRGSYCKEGLKKGERPSKTFLEYVKYLSRHSHKVYTDMHYYYQAYLWSRTPPKRSEKLPSYLGINFAGIEADFSKPFDSKTNQNIWKDLLSWKAFSDDIVIWHYTINFGGYMFPFPNFNALDKDIKSFADLDFVKGVFLQGSYETYGGDMAALRVWVFSKLLWNPHLDVDNLIAEFCHYYYGRAWKDVLKYIQTLDMFLKKSGDKLSVKTSIDSSYLSTPNLNKLDEILSIGLRKLEPKSKEYKHYRGLFTGIDYIRLMRGGDFPHKSKVRHRFKQYLRNNPQITAFSEGVKIENILKILDIDRTKERIPEGMKNLRKNINWFSYQEYQMELCCADIVKDVQASDGVSAVMDGSSKEWGFSLPLRNLPQGKWDIYADVRIEKNSDNSMLDNAKIALHYGVYPTYDKGILLVGQLGDGYKRLKIATIDTQNSKAESVWLSPPGNEIVKKVYVDRIYFVKH